MKEFYVYIMASRKRGTLYIGVTNNLAGRVRRHKSSLASRFTKRYGVKNLVYYEEHDNIQQAMNREKQMKQWNRQWKMRLIEKFNPNWEDLYSDMVG